MGVVAVRAVTLRSRMLELRLLDLLGLVRVATDTDFPNASLGQYYFSVLCRFMADFAEFLAKRRMHKRLHQLRPRRLVRVVTTHAVCLSERLALVRFDQTGVSSVVTIQTECRGCLSEVICKFQVRRISGLVGNVASVTAEIEGFMTTAVLGNTHPCVVAGEAEILCGTGARTRLEQFEFVVRTVRIMTLQTVPRRWTMHMALRLSSVFVRVTLQA